MTTAAPPESLVAALMKADAYDHPVDRILLVETHISWIFLTGTYAYKVKKPVDLGFLDFSSLEKRRFFCEEELRLNRRLAPEIYLDVIPVAGTAQQPRMGGRGDAIEYAVKMLQFAQDAQFDHLLMRDELKPQHLDAVARLAAGFHKQIATADRDMEYGEPELVCQSVAENFLQIRKYLQQDAPGAQLDTLENWSEASCNRLHDVFRQRKADGFVRECHGDMHLRNLAWVDGRPLAFDCIEFSPQLRWIDVVSEIAFLVMDLQGRDQQRLAWRFLNTYLEYSGDYSGVSVLPFYLCYRAMVRAKVEAIRSSQPGIDDDERATVLGEFHGYMKLARAYTAAASPVLIITRGASASGKTTLTCPLLEQLGAIRIRSDVERKRLFGLPCDADGRTGLSKGIYTPEASRLTYEKLAELAGHVLAAGYTVIVDAACLQAEQVASFRALAEAAQVAFVILEFTASAEVLRQRIEQRENDVSDADRTVLEHQLSNWQELSEHDRARCIRIDTEAPFDVDVLIAQVIARKSRRD